MSETPPALRVPPAAPLAVETVTGAALVAVLPELARLRIAVFRDFPYLYDGTLAYEESYLAKFAAAPGAVCVVARDGGHIVGASTGAPLVEQEAEFQSPFSSLGIDPARVFYCSESVLQRAYRGRGLGHVFFDRREAHARTLGGFTHVAFASVVRPADHPLRPADYQPLDAFWIKRGYTKAEGLIAHFAWTDIDRPGETSKEMQFWSKPL